VFFILNMCEIMLGLATGTEQTLANSGQAQQSSFFGDCTCNKFKVELHPFNHNTQVWENFFSVFVGNTIKALKQTTKIKHGLSAYGTAQALCRTHVQVSICSC